MDWRKFELLMGSEWALKFKPFLESQECDNIYAKLKTEVKRGKIICPESKNLWRVFKQTPYEELKCIIVLQDPYPYFWNNEMVASGVALDCSLTNHVQPSLHKFYEGIENELFNGLNLNYIKEPCLDYLSQQGILLLNSALTVEKEKPGSHKELWRPFMQFFFEEIINNYNPGLVIILSGKDSFSVEKYINPLLHYILKCEHPAAAAHQYRSWNTEGVFKKANTLLKDNYNFEPSWLYTLPF